MSSEVSVNYYYNPLLIQYIREDLPQIYDQVITYYFEIQNGCANITLRMRIIIIILLLL